MDSLSKLFLILTFITTFTSNTNGEDVCVKKGPCTCEFSNGTGIDLSPTNKSTFLMTTNFALSDTGNQYKLSTYYYHPCYDLVPQVNNTTPNDTCNNPLTLCRHVSTFTSIVGKIDTYQKDATGISSFLGNTNGSTFSANGNSIIYTNNKPSSNNETIVLLICAETEDRLHIDPALNNDPAKIVLTFFSKYACLRTIESPDEGRSFGSTLLIVFFSFVIFYLVLGVCTKKFLMGATGIEVIPNLGFWTDLPNLVKDGWAFSVNGFKLPARGPGPVSSPDPNSYDSI